MKHYLCRECRCLLAKGENGLLVCDRCKKEYIVIKVVHGFKKPPVCDEQKEKL